jgi:hypothetical protein
MTPRRDEDNERDERSLDREQREAFDPSSSERDFLSFLRLFRKRLKRAFYWTTFCTFSGSDGVTSICGFKTYAKTKKHLLAELPAGGGP